MGKRRFSRRDVLKASAASLVAFCLSVRAAAPEPTTITRP